MRMLVVAALVLSSAAGLRAADDTPKLEIGSVAPPLRVTRWLKGEPVTFAPGKVYVVDFWATWCGPCIASMPHLDELARTYRERGLTAVAVTTADPNNSADAVEAFVKGQGSKFGFGFAYCEDDATWQAYMEAAGRDSIPCSFVIGKDGKVAYIGHPKDLEDVLPGVLDGTWRGKADADRLAKADAFLGTILATAEKDPARALAEMDEFARSYPARAAREQYVMTRPTILLMANRVDEAKVATESALAIFRKAGNAMGLAMLALTWTSPQTNPGRHHVEDLGLVAVDASLAVKSEENRLPVLMMAADSYFAAGRRERAAELADQAIAAAPDGQLKKLLTERFAKLKAEPRP